MPNHKPILEGKVVLLAYYFVMFGILAGLNMQTALQDFSWGGSGSQNFQSIWNNPTLDNIEVWYMLAGVVFLVQIPVFVGLFVFYYLLSPIVIQNKKRLILEFFYLSFASGFSVVALNLSRIILVSVPKIYPNYSYQVEYLKLEGSTMAQWTQGFPPATEIVHIGANSSIFVILVYFIILIFLHFLRKWKINPIDQKQS